MRPRRWRGRGSRWRGVTDALLLVAPVAWPLLWAAIAMLVRTRPRAAAVAGAIGVAGMAAAAVLLFVRATGGGALPLTVFGGWPRAFAVSFDGRLPGVLLVLVSAVVAVAGTLFAFADIGARRRRAGYDALMLALFAGVNGAFLTGDLFNLYVWFELALVAALGLLTIDRRAGQLDGATRYAAFAMAGATFILCGIGLLYGSYGTLDIAVLAKAIAARPVTVATTLAAALLLSGFALKSGLAPFHVWLPVAYPVAPLTVAAVFGGLLTKMGFYALLLTVGTMFGGGGAVAPLMGWIAATTMLLCAAGALAQTDMRRMIAYHVVAQVGYMMAGLAAGTQAGVAAAIVYMVHSILVQANLFLGVGAIRRATGSWNMTQAGGMTRSNPVFAFLFAVPVLSLAGIPPLSGFWAKLVVMRAGIAGGAPWLVLAALVAAILTLMSMAFLWSEACWKTPAGDRRVRPVPPAMLAGMAVLSAATLAIGLMPDRLFLVARQSAAMLARMGGGA